MKQFFLLFAALVFTATLSAQEVILKNGKYYNSGKKLYTGLVKEYDDNGALKSGIWISNGLLDSISTFYFPSGNKQEQRSYSQGKKHGLWIIWDANGTKTAEARFTDGKKDGFWYVWDEKGTKRYEMFYTAGEKRGVWFIWDSNGKLITETKYN